MTTERKRSTYFNALELEVLMLAYADYEHIFHRKSNTAAAAKEREAAWEKIAARVNACNSKGERRTWQQQKMKHKNIIQNANRKKAEARKTGGGPPPPPLTEAEELALSQNRGRPAAEGIPGGSSSEPVTPQDTSAYEEEEEDDEETLSAATGRDPEGPTEESHLGGVWPDDPATLAPNVGLLRPGRDTEGLSKAALEPPAAAEDSHPSTSSPPERQRRPAEERGGSAATATGNRLSLASPGSSLEQPRPAAPLPGDQEPKAPCSRRRWGGGIMPRRPGGGGYLTDCSRPSESYLRGPAVGPPPEPIQPAPATS
ncbi:hypothetical protein N1851_006423 [Merluccius polli]|uniref:Myb/SANT-like DNA-binding domain-containing protein n=1 Tax=Merluccius polli TaxID=89951 RepID=A0AA47P646_MERPO|nr:hypothetical protein N1851_006423 [Merluccius polli]